LANHALKTILIAGAIAGILDITYAVFNYFRSGVKPIQVLHQSPVAPLGGSRDRRRS
jgi:hypothetical protein